MPEIGPSSSWSHASISRMSTISRSPGSAPSTRNGPLSTCTPGSGAWRTSSAESSLWIAPSNHSRQSARNTSPGLTLTTGGMSGCHRLCPTCCWSVNFFVLSSGKRFFGMSVLSAAEQVAQRLVDEVGVDGIGAAAGEVAPHSRDDPEFGVGHVPDLVFVVLRREVELLLGRHDDRAGLDRPERLFKRAVEALGLADVAVLPGPQHRQQVVGVAVLQEEALPETDEEVLERGEPHLPVALLEVERLREPPPGVDARRRSQPARGLPVVPAVLPLRVGGQRRLDALQEHDVVRARARRTAERQDPR